MKMKMKIKDVPLLDKLIKARTQMIITLPFIASSILMLKLVEDYSVKTAKTNGTVIKYNPVFVNTLEFDEIKWLLAHEALHCVLLHHTRFGMRIFKLWNIAGDIVIALILEECKSLGLKRIDGVYYDVKYYNMATEEVYNALNQLNDQEKDDLINEYVDIGEFEPSSKGGMNSIDDTEISDEDGSDDDNGNKEDDSIDEGTDGSGEEPGNEDDETNGGGSDNDDKEPEKNNDQDSSDNGGENEDVKETGKQNINEQEDKWKIFSIQSKLVVAKLGGTEAGMGSPYLNRLIKDIIESKLNWRQILYAFIDQFSKNDYNWNRPCRRYIAQDLYLPSLYDEEIGQIVVVWDTSGSIDQDMLDSFNAEMNAMKIAYGMDITALYVDDEITDESVQVFSRYEMIECKPVGGGGTDFRPPFKYLEDNQIVPACLIYFTDGRCNKFPNETPDYPVLWVGTLPFSPPFGEFILLTD